MLFLKSIFLGERCLEEPSADQVVVPVGSSRAPRKAGYRRMGEPPQSPSPVPKMLRNQEVSLLSSMESSGSVKHGAAAGSQETQRPPAQPGPTSGLVLEARRRPWLRG